MGGALLLLSGCAHFLGGPDHKAPLRELTRSEAKSCRYLEDVRAESGFPPDRDYPSTALKRAEDKIRMLGGDAYIIDALTVSTLGDPQGAVLGVHSEKGEIKVQAYACPQSG